MSQAEDLAEKEAERQTKWKSDLIEAAADADVETVKELLTVNPCGDIDATTASGMTALYTTVLYNNEGCEEVVDLLLKHGAKHTIRDGDGETPLWRAAAEGNEKNVELLLEKGSDVDAVSNGGTPMLYRAAGTGNKRIMSMLLEKKPKLEAKDPDGETPLWRAAEGMQEDTFRLLLDAGADVNAKDSRLRSILHRVVNGDQPNLMAMLLGKMELDIDPKDDDGATPLWRAVSDDRAQLIPKLLAKQADIKAKDKRGVSILHLAAEKGEHQLVVDMIHRGAEVNATDDYGKSPLSQAVASGSKATVELLLTANANIEHRDRAGVTIFHEAVKADNIEIVKMLLEKLTDIKMSAARLVGAGPLCLPDIKIMIDSKAEDGETPLLRAVMNRTREIVDLLLYNGAKLQAFDRYGDSELSCATSRGDDDIVRLLLDHKPKIESKGLGGMTAFLWAAYGGYDTIGRLLFSNGADISAATIDGETALYYATCFGHVSFMEMLFKLSTDIGILEHQTTPLSDAIEKKGNLSLHSKLGIESKNGEGGTPLLIAAGIGSKEAVALLLKNRANYEVKDDQGWTALHHATQSESLEAVNTLLSTASSAIVNEKNNDGNTALHLAATGDESIVQALLEKCPPISGDNTIEEEQKDKVAISLVEKNNSGETALSLALQQEAAGVVQLLVKHAADIEYIEEPDETDPTKWVQWPVMVESNIEASAVGDLLVQRKSKWKEDVLEILYWAARNGLQKLVHDMLSKNSSQRGEALYWAAVGGQKSVVDSLLGISKDEFRKFFTANDARSRALLVAARFGYQDVVNQLLEGFKKFDQESITADHAGPKAVQAAARNGHHEVVQQLIKTLMDCKPDEYRLRNHDEDTRTWKPLHWAIHYRSKKSDVIVRNILMNGADGASVLEVAKNLEGLDRIIVEMLKTPLRVTRKPVELFEPKDQTSLVEAACKPFDTNIIDIYTWEGQSCTIERIGDVHEIIYTRGNGPRQVMENARKAWKLDSIGLEHRYRWIHLPANNWTWVEDLMKRILSESRWTDDAYTRLKNFVDLNSREHIGTTQSRCVYPFIAFESEDIFSGKGLNTAQILRSLQGRARKDQEAKSKKWGPAQQSAVVDGQEIYPPEGANTTQLQAQVNNGIERNGNFGGGTLYPRTENPLENTKMDKEEVRDPKANDRGNVQPGPKQQRPNAPIKPTKLSLETKESSREPKPTYSLQGSQMALCMPFLTFQKVKSHRALRQAIRVVEEIVASNPADLLEESSSLEMTKIRTDARLEILIKEHKTGLDLLIPDTDGIKSVEVLKNNCLAKLKDAVSRGVSGAVIALSIEPLREALTELRNTKLFYTPENTEWMERFHDAIELYEQTLSSQKDFSSGQFKYELLLLQYYTKPEDPKGLHVSRTLDQYYYSALSDTTRRDMDQVVRRYQAKTCNEGGKVPNNIKNGLNRPKNNKRKKRKGKGKSNLEEFQYQNDPDAKIGMVDQLWLWIIDEKTVITCFPQNSGPESENRQPAGSLPKDKKTQDKELLDKIRTHIHDEARPRISSVYHLATIITSLCIAEVEDCRADIKGSESFLHMFASSISTVADAEVKCFEAFKRDIRKGEDSDDEENEDATAEHHVLDEIELLEEIKDIRDELNILKSIFEDQKDLLQKLFSLIAGSHPGENHSPKNDPVLNYYQERSNIDLRIEKVHKMDKDAKTVYDSLNHLLELKQKNANILEAVQARKQAVETTKQGRTIMVFTIVTIIFLPLSFLTSMYALNIESFPHLGDSVAYPSQWIFSRIFGTSVAIAFPLVIIAFYINSILDWWDKHVVKRYQKHKARKEREEKENAHRTQSWPSTVSLGQSPRTKKKDAGSKPTIKSQLLSKISREKTTRGRGLLPTSLTPSEIEAGKQPFVEEKPDK